MISVTIKKRARPTATATPLPALTSITPTDATPAQVKVIRSAAELSVEAQPLLAAIQQLQQQQHQQHQEQLHAIAASKQCSCTIM